jgi:hypothetical protein
MEFSRLAELFATGGALAELAALDASMEFPVTA